MTPRLKALQNKMQALIDEGAALKAKDTHTDEESERYAQIPGEINQAKEDIAAERVVAEQFEAAMSEGNTFLNGSPKELKSIAGQIQYAEDKKSYESLSKMRSRGKYFQLVAERNDLSRSEARQLAYRFGMFMAATVLPSAHPMRKKAMQYCKEQGIAPSAVTHSEGDPDHGAALVVPEFENIMIDLKEVFGVFRQYANYVPMASDTKSRPRRKGGLTAYHVGSSTAAAQSDAEWNRVQLVAKKIMVLAKYESEIGEDAIVDFGDTLAGEMSYACAVREDSDGFNGTGTSDSGGIVGVRQRLLDVFTTAGGAGLILGAGNAYSELTLPNFQSMKGAVPLYAETMGDIAWYCSKVFFETVMAPLALAAGGVSAAEIVAGVRRQFLGYPVRLSQSMPTAAANSQVPCFLGALELAAMFGDRRQTTIAFSEHSSFTTDDIDAKCTERYDINVHDVGATGTAGPIVGLIMAAA